MPRTKGVSDEAVLDAAIRVMLRTGPGGFTLAEAGREAGVSAATLLQRFGDKQTLVVRALARDVDGFIARLGEAPQAPSREAVLDLFWLVTPDTDDPQAFVDQRPWLREDFLRPELNQLSRQMFTALRAAVAQRLPPLPFPAETAARLLEAQWQGAMNQWGFFQEGRLPDYVAQSLNEWFDAMGAATA
ncbi:MAG TPA: TetR/AcrR family transcriptional regulator [Caulobacteraceae bacterium]